MPEVERNENVGKWMLKIRTNGVDQPFPSGFHDPCAIQPHWLIKPCAIVTSAAPRAKQA
jgi:hypothetical protein